MRATPVTYDMITGDGLHISSVTYNIGNELHETHHLCFVKGDVPLFAGSLEE